MGCNYELRKVGIMILVDPDTRRKAEADLSRDYLVYTESTRFRLSPFSCCIHHRNLESLRQPNGIFLYTSEYALLCLPLLPIGRGRPSYKSIAFNIEFIEQLFTNIESIPDEDYIVREFKKELPQLMFEAIELKEELYG